MIFCFPPLAEIKKCTRDEFRADSSQRSGGPCDWQRWNRTQTVYVGPAEKVQSAPDARQRGEAVYIILRAAANEADGALWASANKCGFVKDVMHEILMADF